MILALLTVLLRLTLAVLSYRGDGSPALLDELSRHFTAEDIRQGELYARGGFRLRLIAPFLTVAVPLAFLLTPLGKRLEDWLLRESKGRRLLSVVLFAGVYFVVRVAVFLPLSFLSSFVLEHRFGFSAQSLLDWILLVFRGNAIALVEECVAVAVAYLVVTRLPRAWVFVVPVLVGLAAVYQVILYPAVVTPLVYEIEPLPAGPLRVEILKLCAAARFDVSDVSILKTSAVSSHTNAFFVGFGRRKRIFLSDTLVSKHPPDEVVSVLAHELGHSVHHHVLLGVLLSIPGAFVLCLLVRRLFAFFRMDEHLHLGDMTDPSSVPLVSFVVTVLLFLATPVESAISRRAERQADRESLRLAGDPASFIRSEVRLSRENKSRLNPNPIVVLWGYTHPPAIERIRMAEAAPPLRQTK